MRAASMSAAYEPRSLMEANLAVLFETSRERLIMPFLQSFYSGYAEPYGWAAFRLTIGGMLMIEGWPKIIAPMAQVGFVESIGMYPGWFFSPFLAVLQFVGGFLIIIGLLTRPVALANAVMLLMTLWYHMSHPYGDAFLTVDGIAYLKENAALLTAAGQKLLADGGVAFLTGVQMKANLASLFWAAGAAVIAALGGGAVSVDRMLGKEF